MSSSNPRFKARKEILARTEQSNWDEVLLINAVVALSDLPEESVKEALDDLKKRGEVYTVNGEVRKT